MTSASAQQDKRNSPIAQHVFVFAPYITLKTGELYSVHYDVPSIRHEIDELWMKPLGLSWEWVKVCQENLEEVVQNVLKRMQTHRDVVVFQLCDGNDSDGYPGIEVVRALEKYNIPFTGGDSLSYELTTAKSLMKEIFIKQGVSTAPYVKIDDVDRDVARAVKEIGLPLFIKPDVCAGSYGIEASSVCFDEESAKQRVLTLRKGMHGMNFEKSAILAEMFVEGPEFTVFAQESPGQGLPFDLWVLPPGERVFSETLPPAARFLAFEISWAGYDLPGVDTKTRPAALYSYATAAAKHQEALTDITRRATHAVGDVGYSRVDIRMHEKTGVFYVLEVNSYPGFTANPDSTVGSLLRLANVPISECVARALRHAFSRARIKAATK